jgi:hypothetical protein
MLIVHGQPLSGHDIRTAILAGMLEASKPKAPGRPLPLCIRLELTSVAALPASIGFDDIISDYLPARSASPTPPKATIPPPRVPKDWLDGLL